MLFCHHVLATSYSCFPIACDICVKQRSGLPCTRCTSISTKGNQEREIAGI